MQRIRRTVGCPVLFLKQFVFENWQGATIGVFMVTLVLMGIVGLNTTLGFNPVLTVPLVVVAGGVFLFLTAALVDLLRLILISWPRLLTATVFGCIVFIGVFIHILSRSVPIAIGAGALYSLVQVFFGGAIYSLFRGTRSRTWPLVVFAVTLTLNVFGLIWLLGNGSVGDIITETLPQQVQLDLPNPGLPGSYGVATLTYGSGVDRRRAEYGGAVDLLTASVDGTIFHPKVTGLSALYRNWFWGFGASELPLNGRVWYPEG